MDFVKELHSRDYKLIYSMGVLYCTTHKKTQLVQFVDCTSVVFPLTETQSNTGNTLL